MYQFSDDLNYDVFFRFDKRWIENMNWASLPKSSKAILPVIAVHSDAKGESFPSERTLAILSGCSDKTVREGIRGLIGFPGFNVDDYITKRGRRAKKFRLIFPPEGEEGRSFFFYKLLIEGGNWRLLNPASKALYPVMRHFAYFDKDLYLENEEGAADKYDPMEFEEFYKARKWDCCEAETSILAEYSHITRPSVYGALKDLEEHSLIEKMGKNDEGVSQWKVFIKVPKYYKREFLNAGVARTYGKEK